MPEKNKLQDISVPEKVLITGATSPIGISLARKLVAMGSEVRVLVTSGPEYGGEWGKLPAGVVPFVGDFTLKNPSDMDVLIDACRDVDVLYHLGSANYNYQYKYKILIDTNVIGTENMVSAYVNANKASQKPLHVVFSSTTSVYGYKRPGEVLTEESTTSPTKGYAESKLMAERVIDAFATANRTLSYTILRMSRLYGLGYEAPFFKVFRLIEEGKAMYIGGGRNHITLLHMDDAVNALLASLNNPAKTNRIYNVSDGVPYTLRELLDMASEMLGVERPKKAVSTIVAKFLTSRAHNLKYDEFEFLTSDRTISIDKIHKELSFWPSVSIEEGAKELVDAFLKQKS
ncbi:MAG: NAD-dependent epimerase/dehydratase family protein [Candidatus Micrarchaeia archaeon]